jgi:hypothetical protein
MTIKDAKRYLKKHHRTHTPCQGGLFALGVADDGRVCGVAVVGRPISRIRQVNEPFTVELTRCATDGTRNANSKLYRAAWRAARQLRMAQDLHEDIARRERRFVTRRGLQVFGYCARR